MRIAIDARELVGRPTGVGRYLRELLTAWAALPGAAPHEFVLCAPEPIHVAGAGRLRLSHAVAAGRGTWWEQWSLPRLVRSVEADVLFSPAYTCPLRCGVPVVLTIHDVSFCAHPEWFSWREGLRRRTLTGLSAHRADRVLTESVFSKHEIVRYLRLGPSRVQVIPLGVSTPDARAPREPLVLYVGSIFNRRHVPELIEGFARMARGSPALRLEIVGDNRSRPRLDLDRLIATQGATDRIHARSYVPDTELADLYARASAFVFLSDYEGFGLTPLEAMAAGVPVIVLDTDIAREIYGPAATYLPRPEPALIASALERVLEDEEERQRLLEAGAMRVARYTWQECAHRTLQTLLATP